MPSSADGLALGGAFASDSNDNLVLLNTNLEDAVTARIAAQVAQAAAELAEAHAETAEVNAELAETNVAADLVLTNADVVATGNDRTAIETLYDTFDDRYLGTKVSDPTVDNDGAALLIGAMYFNSTVNNTKFYNGSTWEDPEATATTGANTATTKANEAAASAAAALVSEGLTDADRVVTNADVVLTHADVVLTHADVLTTADKLPKSGGALTGPVTTTSTFDGRDVATDGTKLDGIAASANNYAHPANHAISVITGLQTTLDSKLPLAGGALTGAVTTNSTFDGRDVATDGTKLDGIAASANNYTHPANHAISVITGLQAALDAKSATSHNHNTSYDPIGASVAMAIALGG